MMSPGVLVCHDMTLFTRRSRSVVFAVVLWRVHGPARGLAWFSQADPVYGARGGARAAGRGNPAADIAAVCQFRARAVDPGAGLEWVGALAAVVGPAELVRRRGRRRAGHARDRGLQAGRWPAVLARGGAGAAQACAPGA